MRFLSENEVDDKQWQAVDVTSIEILKSMVTVY